MSAEPFSLKASGDIDLFQRFAHFDECLETFKKYKGLLNNSGYLSMQITESFQVNSQLATLSKPS